MEEHSTVSVQHWELYTKTYVSNVLLLLAT
jgi:hypothetical protein